jgi:HKD family nuclease
MIRRFVPGEADITIDSCDTLLGGKRLQIVGHSEFVDQGVDEFAKYIPGSLIVGTATVKPALDIILTQIIQEIKDGQEINFCLHARFAF